MVYNIEILRRRKPTGGSAPMDKHRRIDTDDKPLTDKPLTDKPLTDKPLTDKH
jgi:hypothetical protein